LIDHIVSQLEIPRRLRALVRARESSLIVLAALVGAIAGLVVSAMGTGVDGLHRLFFQLDPGVRLSGLLRLDPVLAISVPLGGGIVFGIFRELIARWRPEREIDPIEANALHGGRMSLLGSIIVAAQTVWSIRGAARCFGAARLPRRARARPSRDWCRCAGADDCRHV
jgi:CIC family chloride channel protein